MTKSIFASPSGWRHFNARSIGTSPAKIGAIAYSAPIAGAYFINMPMWSILPGVYAKYFGLSLTSIAAAVLIIRMFDGIIDIGIGYSSDWLRSRGVSRKVWVLVGTIGSIIACYFLFVPPAHPTLGYYIGWSLAYFLSFTMAEIPHLTWGSELSLDPQDRAYVFGVRNFVMNLGILAFYALPLLPMFVTAEYTPTVMQAAAHIGAILSISGLLFLMVAPAGVPAVRQRSDNARIFIRSLVSNRPLMVYFGASISQSLCYGMWFGLLYFYLDTYLGMASSVALILLLATSSTLIWTPIAVALIKRTSSKTVWIIGTICFVLQLFAAALLGRVQAWWIPVIVVSVANACISFQNVAVNSVLGDISDYGKLIFRRERGATYFALQVFLSKIGLGVGGAVALGVAGFLGFDPQRSTQDAEAVLGLQVGFLALPLVLAILSIWMVSMLPLDARRQQIVRRRLYSLSAKSREGTEPPWEQAS